MKIQQAIEHGIAVARRSFLIDTTPSDMNGWLASQAYSLGRSTRSHLINAASSDEEICLCGRHSVLPVAERVWGPASGPGQTVEGTRAGEHAAELSAGRLLRRHGPRSMSFRRYTYGQIRYDDPISRLSDLVILDCVSRLESLALLELFGRLQTIRAVFVFRVWPRSNGGGRQRREQNRN